jgi:hypothetical protein
MFVISETKMSLKMGSWLPVQDYNVYEEMGIPCTNHHISKWGIIIGVRKDIQVSQYIFLSHVALIVNVILGTSSGKGFIHRIIGAYAPWNPGGQGWRILDTGVPIVL